MTGEANPQSRDDAPSPAGRRLQFGLRSLVLGALILLLSVSHVHTSMRLYDVEDHLRRLRRDVGELTIDNPNQPHAIALPAFEGQQPANSPVRQEVNDLNPPPAAPFALALDSSHWLPAAQRDHCLRSSGIPTTEEERLRKAG